MKLNQSDIACVMSIMIRWCAHV